MAAATRRLDGSGTGAGETSGVAGPMTCAAAILGAWAAGVGAVADVEVRACMAVVAGDVA